MAVESDAERRIPIEAEPIMRHATIGMSASSSSDRVNVLTEIRPKYCSPLMPREILQLRRLGARFQSSSVFGGRQHEANRGAKGRERDVEVEDSRGGGEGI